MNMKKIIIAFILPAFILGICGCNRQSDMAKESKTVAYVNGEEITSDEFQYFKSKLKAQVMNEYLEKYTESYSPDFWTKSFNGKTPEKALNEQTLEKCVMAKLQLVLMKQKGIYTDITYKGLYDKAVAFNEENSSKQGVVGLKSIKLEQFYTYYLDNGVMELRNILVKKETKPSDNELKKCIQQLKDSKQYAEITDFNSIAASKLAVEKYNQYIAKLREKANVKIIDLQ